jgi:hypothetical protein
MSQPRTPPRPLSLRETESFTTTEEAWFWYIQCQTARNDGVRFTAGLAATERPCEPDDIIREVHRLYRRHAIKRGHISVLERYGCRLSPPNPHGEDSPIEARLWEEALDRLATPLRRKGIVL